MRRLLTCTHVRLPTFLIALMAINSLLTWPATAVRILPDAERLAANEVLHSLANQHDNTNNEHHRRLLNVEVPLPASPDDHLVHSLPLLPEGTFPTQHWAGLLPASNEGDKYFFYWLFAPDLSQNSDLQDADIPLIIWLNGGPGCSSMDGLFLENGPLRFELKESGSYQLVPAQHSWHKTPAYTLYIDQPVATGLSFTTSKKYPRNDKEVNVDFHHFLQSFFSLHADKFVNAEQRMYRPLYFSGESHAGHYIPSMMAFILDQNTNAAANNQIYIPLSGAAIGNGWVDPFHQYAAAEAAYGHGIIGRAQMTALADKEKECQGLLNQKRYSSSVCFNLLDDIVTQSYGSKSNFKVSQYDVRKVESRRGARNFPPGHKIVETYLGGIGHAEGMTPATMTQALEAIHATPSRTSGQVYQECGDAAYDALAHQDGLGVVNEVVQVLEHDDKIRLLFFNGVTDLICNHVGNEVLLEKLPWKNQEAYVKASRAAWKSKTQAGDKISGYIKEFENLLYLKVMDSGHMVPMDVPDVALDMMRLFIYGGANAFQYSPQSLHRAVDQNDSCPTCPVCPANITNYEIDSVNASEEAGNDAADGGGSNRAVWMGLAIGFVITLLVTIVVLVRRSRYGKHNVTATYDLEMRGGTYFDDPVGDSSENGSSNEKFR